MKWLDRRAMPPLPYFTLCKSEREWKQTLKGMDNVKTNQPWVVPGSNATTHTFDNAKGESVMVVCITDTKKRRRSEVIGLLVHEGVHIWQEYRDNVIRETKPSPEMEAYVIQWIAQELVLAFDKSMGVRYG